MGLSKIGNSTIAKKYLGTKEILKEVLNGVVLYSKTSSFLPPIITLENNNVDFVITPQNVGEEQYEIYINGTSIGIFNQNYTFLHNGATLTKCLGKEYYTGEITTPAELDNTSITTLSSGLFANCEASKIVISEGVTTDNASLFNANTETVNVVYPSTMTKFNSLSSYPSTIKIGYTGYIEYGYTNSIPASAFAFSKTITTATTFYFDIKSMITNIGNNAFKTTISGNYATTYNMYFRQSASETVTFGTTIIGTGTQKATRTYNIYTDNEGIKTTFESYAAQYTTVNVYHLDGSAWE